jgi:hypothetical protein
MLLRNQTCRQIDTVQLNPDHLYDRLPVTLFGLKKTFNIDYLQSGGLITNYYCTSQCGHCLYGCSPAREKRYIDEETTQKNFEIIKGLGCHMVHVGGGEPFLNVDGLKMVLHVAKRTNMGVAYVETNSSWCRDEDAAADLLAALKQQGLSTLLVSISPFHNEYIPFSRVKAVAGACKRAGITVFPWISDFYSEIDTFDDKKTHKMTDYERRFGPGYLKKLPSRYWIHLGGRALKTFETVFEKKDVEATLSLHKRGCGELQDVSHFHLDLFGNYVPGLCSGLAIRREDLGRPIDRHSYPFLSALFKSGVRGLFHIASGRYGFQPSDGYISKCHLCFDVRRFLVLEKGMVTQELQPVALYENV